MISKDGQSAPRQRRFYPPARESTGNFLRDASIRGVRAFFQKSINAAMNDGSLGAFLGEIGYDLVKRSTKKVKPNPLGKTAVPHDATGTKDSKPKAAKRRTGAA